MQPGKTARESCPWSGKWRAATEHTKLTALPGQPQFPLNWWPIFSSQRKEREGERAAKKKAPFLHRLTLAEANVLVPHPSQEELDPLLENKRGNGPCDGSGAAAPNPAVHAAPTNHGCYSWGKGEFPECRDVQSKKDPEIKYSHINNHSKTYVFRMPVDLNAGPEVPTQYFLGGKTTVKINVNII